MIYGHQVRSGLIDWNAHRWLEYLLETMPLLSIETSQHPTMITASAIQIDGEIYTGRRHHNIINSTKELNLPFGYFRKGEQGFIDDKHNFLDRKQAAKHALDCGQIQKLKFHRLKLFSEDLW